MASKKMKLAMVECDCGKHHFVVFGSEFIFCRCCRILDVDEKKYGVMDPEDHALFMQDYKAQAGILTACTRFPPELQQSKRENKGKGKGD